jgi:hypothetical protein
VAPALLLQLHQALELTVAVLAALIHQHRRQVQLHHQIVAAALADWQDF